MKYDNNSVHAALNILKYMPPRDGSIQMWSQREFADFISKIKGESNAWANGEVTTFTYLFSNILVPSLNLNLPSILCHYSCLSSSVAAMLSNYWIKGTSLGRVRYREDRHDNEEHSRQYLGVEDTVEHDGGSRPRHCHRAWSPSWKPPNLPPAPTNGSGRQ